MFGELPNNPNGRLLMQDLGPTVISFVIRQITTVHGALRRLKKPHRLQRLALMLLCISVRRTTPEAASELQERASADTFFRWAKGFKPLSLATQLSCVLIEFALCVVAPFLGTGVVIAYDIVKLPYYGKLTSEFMTGGKAERGTAYFTQFLTVSVVLCGLRFPLALHPLKRGDRRRLAALVTSYYRHFTTRFPILLILLDRGFGSAKCVHALQHLSVLFVVGLSHNPRLKRLSQGLGLTAPPPPGEFRLEARDGQVDFRDTSGAVLTGYQFGKPRATTRLALYLYEIKYRRGRRRGQQVQRTAAFVTNLACAPSDIRALYGRRWSIETGYRGINTFRGWTRCRWAAPRVWLYGVAILFHAVWVAANVDAKQPKEEGHALAISETTHAWIKQRTLRTTIDAYLPQPTSRNRPSCPKLLARACE